MASDRLGNYRLLSRLGAGGTGTVFKAQQENLNRVVALKVLHPGFGRQAALVKRFKREILTTAALSHPNLVKVYDAGQDGDRYYFSMEFIDGYPLRDRLRGGKSVPPKEAIRFTHQLADAIRYLHAKGMVHRDIKPENIMVCTDGNVKLMDFGIVKVQDQTVLTQEGSTVGTPRYMSPEMVTGEPQDLRSDIYQMGVILYEMLAGKCPFDGPTISDIANKITDEPAQPPSLSASGLSLGLDRVVMRCLEKNPADRYPDAEAFDLDLTEAESDLDTGGRLTTRPLQPRRGPSVQAHTPPPVAQQPAQVQTQALPAQPSRVPLPGGDGETWVERSYRTLSDSLQEPSVRKGLLLSPVAFLLGLGIVFWLLKSRAPDLVSPPSVEEGLASLQVRWETLAPTQTEVEVTDAATRSTFIFRNATEEAATRHTLITPPLKLKKGSEYEVRVVHPDGARSDPVRAQLSNASGLMTGGPEVVLRPEGTVELIFKTTVPTVAKAQYTRGGTPVRKDLSSGYARKHQLTFETVGPEDEIRDLKVTLEGVDSREEPSLPCVMGGVRLAKEFSGAVAAVPQKDWDSIFVKLQKVLGSTVRAEKGDANVERNVETAQQHLSAWLRQHSLEDKVQAMRLLAPWVFGSSGVELADQIASYKALQRLEDLDGLSYILSRAALLDIAPIYRQFVQVEYVDHPGLGIILVDNLNTIFHYMTGRYRREYQSSVGFDGKFYTLGEIVPGADISSVSAKFRGSSVAEFTVTADDLSAAERIRLVFQMANMGTDVYLEATLNDLMPLRVRNSPKNAREYDIKSMFVASEDLVARSSHIAVSLPAKLLTSGKNRLRISAETIPGIKPVLGATLLKVLYRLEPKGA